MNKRIPILICIDVEPDKRRLEPQARVDWSGFERSYEFFSDLRPHLESATGSPVQFSWFLRMDPQITHIYGSPDWVVTRYCSLIKELEDTGDELGLHVHANRWDEHSEDWIADYRNQEWIDHCVSQAMQAFQTSLDRPCRSFRFGDHWMNDQTVDLLERLGVRFDLTTEFGAPAPQMAGETFTGAFPDYTRIPQLPYHPRKNDFTKPSRWRGRDLWIVPISAGSTASPATVPLGRFPSWRGSHQGPQEYMSLILSFDPTTFSRIANRLLSVLKNPYLALPARSDMAIDSPQRFNLERNIEYLQSHPMIKDFVFETPEQSISRLTS